MTKVRSTVTAIVMASALMAACEGSVSIGARVLEGDEVEEDIADGLEEEVGERPDSIDCPDEVEVEDGGTFECTLTAEDDSTATVEVTMTDDEGGYEYEVVAD